MLERVHEQHQPHDAKQMPQRLSGDVYNQQPFEHVLNNTVDPWKIEVHRQVEIEDEDLFNIANKKRRDRAGGLYLADEQRVIALHSVVSVEGRRVTL